MTVSLYLADIRPLAGRETQLSPLLTQPRRRRLEALQNPDDRLHCLAAGLLLRRVLAVREGDIAYNDRGKPYLLHRDVQFSLSHGGDYAVLATAAQPIGVDIEPIPTHLPPLPKKVLRPEELAWLMAEPTPERFARLWTQLESALKAAGTGFGGAERSYSLLDDACPWHFQALTHNGHLITAAAPGPFTLSPPHLLSPEALCL